MKTIKFTASLLAIFFVLSVSSYSKQAAETKKIIIKEPGVTLNNNAVIIAQKIPVDMELALTYSVIVSAKNTGTTTWNTSDYHLKLSALSADTTNNEWIIPHADLPNVVKPGEEVTFVFNITPWLGEGVYNFQAQLSQNETLFGDPTTPVAITVH